MKSSCLYFRAIPISQLFLSLSILPGDVEGEGEEDGDDGEYVDALSQHGAMFYITGNLGDLQVMSTEDSQDRSEDCHVNTEH